MNDIGSNSPQKESVFKVSKDTVAKFSNNSADVNTAKPQTASTPTPPANEKQLASANKQPVNLAPPLDNLNTANQPVTNAKNNDVPKESIVNKLQSIFTGNFTNLIIKSTLIILLTFFVGYFIVNYNALALKINYWYEVNYKGQKWSDLHPVVLEQAKTTTQKLDENYLYIPTLGIQGKVNWGVEDKDVNAMMSEGLVHYLASALPDDAVGNIYIIGNTSGAIWSNSAYKTIFTLLNKANSDQIITIIYKNKIYSYKITNIKSVGNSKISITPGENETTSTLNLLARYPVGINWSTLVVQGELIKIESNILESMDDKIKNLPEQTSQVNLNPIEITPTTTAVPIPTENNIANPDILPDHFLPTL